MNARILESRDGYAILGALRRRQYTFTRVAGEVGVSIKLVCSTAHGKNNNRKVLRHMLEIGVPVEILHLPPDLRAAGQTTQGTAA